MNDDLARTVLLSEVGVQIADAIDRLNRAIATHGLTAQVRISVPIGSDLRWRSILLKEGFATLPARLCGALIHIDYDSREHAMNHERPAINPRYAAYCAAHGSRSVGQQKAKDRQKWPGGFMAGFIFWNSAMIAEFSVAHRGKGYFMQGSLTEDGHAACDRWLLEQWPAAASISQDDGKEGSP